MFIKISIFVACAAVFVVESKPLEQLGPLKTCVVENGITLETDSLIGTPEQAELAVICILKKENATLAEDDVVIFNTLLVLLREPEVEEGDGNEDVASSDEGDIAVEEPKLDSSSLEASKSIKKRAVRRPKNAYQKGTAKHCYFQPITCF